MKPAPFNGTGFFMSHENGPGANRGQMQQQPGSLPYILKSRVMPTVRTASIFSTLV
jgi:hypothetical protein